MEMEEMDLREYWEIIVKKKAIIFVIFLVTVIGVSVYSFLATPVYEARATLFVGEPASGAQAVLFDGFTAVGKNTTQNYMQIMKSRTILSQVRDTVGLEEESLSSLEKRLTIQSVQGSDILQISMQSTDPAEAQLFVNTLADHFIEWNRHYRQEDRRSARLFIEEQLVTAEENLESAERKLQVFKEQTGYVSPSQETVAMINRLAELDARLNDVEIAKTEITERINQARDKLAQEEETLISSTTISDNRYVVEYRGRLAELEIQLAGAREKYTDRHPSVLALQAEIQDVKAKLAEEVERVVGTETRTINPVHRDLYGSIISQEVELMALQAREAALRNLIGQNEQELAKLPAKEVELARLMRDAKVLEEIYIMLRTRYEETRIAEAMQTADALVLDYAALPQSPVKPRIKLNIAIGAVLGMFLGVGLAFLLEFMDNTVKTKEDVERLLQLPVVGEIPDFEKADEQGRKISFGLKKGREFGA